MPPPHAPVYEEGGTYQTELCLPKGQHDLALADLAADGWGPGSQITVTQLTPAGVEIKELFSSNFSEGSGELSVVAGQPSARTRYSSCTLHTYNSAAAEEVQLAELRIYDADGVGDLTPTSPGLGPPGSV